MPLNDALPSDPGLRLPDPADLVAFLGQTEAFSATPAFGSSFGDSADRFLWDAAFKVLGGNLDAQNQGQNQDCVSHAFGAAIEYLEMIAQAAGESVSYEPISTEAIYGLARVQVGQPFPGGGTAPLYAWKAVQQYGVLPRGVYGQFDLREYNSDLVRQWENQGLPRSLESVVRNNPLKFDAQIRQIMNFDQAAAAIRNGYPVVIASFQNFDFRGGRRQGGYIPPTTQDLGHCMVFIGVRGQEGLCCLNSWGDLQGDVYPDNMPPGAFWVDRQTADGMIRSGAQTQGCLALSLAKGFPARRLDFSF